MKLEMMNEWYASVVAPLEMMNGMHLPIVPRIVPLCIDPIKEHVLGNTKLFSNIANFQVRSIRYFALEPCIQQTFASTRSSAFLALTLIYLTIIKPRNDSILFYVDLDYYIQKTDVAWRMRWIPCLTLIRFREKQRAESSDRCSLVSKSRYCIEMPCQSQNLQMQNLLKQHANWRNNNLLKPLSTVYITHPIPELI